MSNKVEKRRFLLYLHCRYLEVYKEVKSKVQKWGNSLALRIPKSFAEEARVKYGSEVDLQVKDGTLVISPIKEIPSLKSLLNQVTTENIHHETETGTKQGEEFW
jgi:antitoxin MazE